MTPAKPNIHQTNLRVFARADGTHSIMRLYTTLVALELALKNIDRGNYSLLHDVCAMATSFASNSSVTAAATTLHGDLQALSCSDRRGLAARIRSDKYPDIRYVRTDSDFDPPATAEADLARAVASAETLVAELRKEGLPWP
jgi:hypothetical protein